MEVIKFRLLSGDTVDFSNYSGYSEFLDNLGLEEDMIIDVFENITKEDIIEGNKNYVKFSVFRDLLDMIREPCIYWIFTHNSIKDLRYYSTYNLDNPFLKWLMINDTEEEREFKVNVYKELFRKEDLKSDSIINAYLIEDSLEDIFIFGCEKGYLEVMKWVYSLGRIKESSYKININRYFEYVYDESEYNYFRIACNFGNKNVAEWLLNHEDTIKDEDFVWQIGRALCDVGLKGNLEFFKWIYYEAKKLPGFDFRNAGDMRYEEDRRLCLIYLWMCENNKMEIVEWIKSVEEISEDIKNYHRMRGSVIF